jgi:hypothetical protein
VASGVAVKGHRQQIGAVLDRIFEKGGVEPIDRLADTDSHAYQVRTFINSVQLQDVNDVATYCEGLAQLERFAAHLALEGDEASPPISPSQAAAVLTFLSFLETREGCEDHAAGGSAHCGFNHVVRWLSDAVEAFEPSASVRK